MKPPSPPPSHPVIAQVREHLRLVLGGQAGLRPHQLVADDPGLAQFGACFVTLTKNRQLRGCIGSLVAHRPLAEDLLDNAVAAAVRDPRFQPVTGAELTGIVIEISLLTPPQPFPYRDAMDLMARLTPHVHGVILSLNGRRATFLPQVWEQLPDPEQFLGHLCRKASLATNCIDHHPEIQVYTVQKFLEHAGV